MFEIRAQNLESVVKHCYQSYGININMNIEKNKEWRNYAN